MLRNVWKLGAIPETHFPTARSRRFSSDISIHVVDTPPLFSYNPNNTWLSALGQARPLITHKAAVL